MISFLLLIIIYINQYQCADWNADYIKAILEARYCFNNSFSTLLDDLFEKLNDKSMENFYYAKSINFLGQKIQRNIHYNADHHYALNGNYGDLCNIFLETTSYIYREIKWSPLIRILNDGGGSRVGSNTEQINQDTNNNNIELTSNYILYLLNNNIFMDRCKGIEKNGIIISMNKVKECFKEKRKNAISVYIKFKPTI